jgi:2'-5' RNA ligase
LKFRAFISVDARPDQRLASLLRELIRSKADLKVVRPELLHVTLKFLGDTDEDLVGRIADGMTSAVDGIGPFTMRFKGMGAFPSLSSIRVVWVGIEQGEALGEIARRLDSELQPLGFGRDEKGFKPHLTLARTRINPRNSVAIQEIIQANGATDYGEYVVDRILLKKSVLGPQGPAYSTVIEVPLVVRA